MNKLQEFFVSPIGLEPEINIDGNQFYSSPKLKASFTLAFQKSSKGKDIYNDVHRLVQSDIIIPCYKSKNIFSFIKSKLKSDESKYILAFYHIDTKKVIVLIDNNISIFGTASNNSLVSTTMHECMHLAASRNIYDFLKLAYDSLFKYYSEFLKEYFKLKTVNKKDIDEYIKRLLIYEKKSFEYVNNDLSKYHQFLSDKFKNQTELNEDEFLIRLNQYIVCLKIYLISFPTFVRSIRRFGMLLTNLNHAYENAFGEKNIYSTPIQELLSISEVMCIFSEMKSNDSTIKRIFKSIK